MGVSPIELGPFTEGVNLVDPVTKLSDKELCICRNFRVGVRGNFYKRPGHGNYGSSPAQVNGNQLVNLLVRYYKADGSKKLVAAAGSELYYGTDGTGAWNKIDINGTDENMNATNLCDWMVYKDRLYITDGTKPQRFDGTNDFYAGSISPAKPTLAKTSGGNLSPGTYKYFITFITDNMGEGIKGVESDPITLTTETKINLSAIPVGAAGTGVVGRNIYRTIANGSLFYYVGVISDNTTTTFGDTLADSAVGAEHIPTIIPPATARFVIMGHDERAYWFGMTTAGDQSLVRVSDVGFPDRIVSSSGFFTVANNDGDIITGGGLVPGGIVFFKRTSMWLLRAFGYGLINIYPKEKRGAGVGTTAPFSIVTTPIGLIFLSQRGEIYKFDGTNIEEIGRKIASEFKGMTTSAMGLVVACYHDYRYIISYDYRGSKGYNWKTLEYDILTGKWEGPHENGIYYTPSYYSVWDSVLDKGELYWGESRIVTGSYVYGRTEFTSTDRGTKFLSIARSGARALAGLGEVKSTKVFVHGNITANASLYASHVTEQEVKTTVLMNTPVPYSSSKLNGTDDLGPDPTVFKLAGSAAPSSDYNVYEGSLAPEARSRVPMYEFTDGGTAVDVKMNIIQLLAEGLPLK